MEKDQRKAIGGLARAAALSPTERSAIAKNAAEKRWAEHRENKPARLNTLRKPRLVKSLPLSKHLTIHTEAVCVTDCTATVYTATVLEGSTVIRQVEGPNRDLVVATLTGYVAALRDAGIVVHIDVAGPLKSLSTLPF